MWSIIFYSDDMFGRVTTRSVRRECQKCLKSGLYVLLYPSKTKVLKIFTENENPRLFRGSAVNERYHRSAPKFSLTLQIIDRQNPETFWKLIGKFDQSFRQITEVILTIYHWSPYMGSLNEVVDRFIRCENRTIEDEDRCNERRSEIVSNDPRVNIHFELIV